MLEPMPNSEPIPSRGLACSRCGGQRFSVIYVRRTHGNLMRRRRACLQCGQKITTYEGEATRLRDGLPV